MPCTSLCTTLVQFPFFKSSKRCSCHLVSSFHYLYQSIDIFLTPFSEFLPSFISAFTQPFPLLSTLSLQHSTWQSSQRCRSAIVPLQTPEPHLKLTWAHKAMRSPKTLKRCGQKIVTDAALHCFGFPAQTLTLLGHSYNSEQQSPPAAGDHGNAFSGLTFRQFL